MFQPCQQPESNLVPKVSLSVGLLDIEHFPQHQNPSQDWIDNGREENVQCPAAYSLGETDFQRRKPISILCFFTEVCCRSLHFGGHVSFLPESTFQSGRETRAGWLLFGSCWLIIGQQKRIVAVAKGPILATLPSFDPIRGRVRTSSTNLQQLPDLLRVP